LPETIHQVKKTDKTETAGDHHPDLIADLMEYVPYVTIIHPTCLAPFTNCARPSIV
jgi:hypothetical protein